MAQHEAIEGEATVEQIGDRLLMRLPAKASGALSSRGQVAVDGELNGHAFATVLEPDGYKGHWLAIDNDLRTAAEVHAGDRARFSFTPAKAWPEPELPDDLAGALDHAADTAEVWQDITPMARWEWVRWVNATKNPGTRQRRIEVSISKLRGGSRRPCCFDLSACTDPEVAKSGKLIEAT